MGISVKGVCFHANLPHTTCIMEYNPKSCPFLGFASILNLSPVAGLHLQMYALSPRFWFLGLSPSGPSVHASSFLFPHRGSQHFYVPEWISLDPPGLGCLRESVEQLCIPLQGTKIQHIVMLSSVTKIFGTKLADKPLLRSSRISKDQ